MATLKSLVVKETLHIVRDRWTLVIVLVMPVVLLLLFGFAISMEVNSVRVAAVVDRHTDTTRDILMRLQVNPYFKFVGLVSHGDVDLMMRRDKVDVVAVLNSDNDTLRTQIIADASNPVIAQAAAGYVRSVVAGTQANVPVLMRTLYNPQLRSSYNFVPGILGMIFILICAIMTSVSIVSEKETGTMDLLLVSPIRPYTVILGKLIPYFLLSCIVLSAMLAISYLLLDIPFSATVVDVVLLSLIYIAMSLSIGLFISTIVKTQVAALITSAVLFLIPVITLSGMIFPIENMPPVLQWISCGVPARWYISAMRKLMIQQVSLGYVQTELYVLSGITVALIVLAVRRFNNTTK